MTIVLPAHPLRGKPLPLVRLVRVREGRRVSPAAIEKIRVMVAAGTPAVQIAEALNDANLCNGSGRRWTGLAVYAYCHIHGVYRPHGCLPISVGTVELHGLLVGSARVDLAFERQELRSEGAIDVSVEPDGTELTGREPVGSVRRADWAPSSTRATARAASSNQGTST